MEEKSVGIRQYLSFLIPLLLAMAIVISFSVVIARRHTEWKKVTSKREALEKEVSQLQEKNLELHRLRDSLIYDPVQIEKEAREQLGYSRPAEVILKGKDSSAGGKAVPDTSEAAKKEDPPSPPTKKGILEKVGILSFLVGIIFIIAGFFSLTYWYEHRRICQ